jgi:DNA gyrase subunit A
VTAKGQSIHFKESDIREMGRSAGGVRAMKLAKSDELVGIDVVRKDHAGSSYVLVMSANGLGKKTALKEYKVQKRGGSGIKTAKVTTKTGDLIVAKVISQEEELIAMSKKGQVIRTQLSSVPSLGRQTQGVSIMKMRAGDGIASLTCL